MSAHKKLLYITAELCSAFLSPVHRAVDVPVNTTCVPHVDRCRVHIHMLPSGWMKRVTVGQYEEGRGDAVSATVLCQRRERRMGRV
ncbi:hypothetical protein EYF80_060229 [Liparis tanakae]|uniref:Uncharacterized protein n=1 Tax=Liparis tanakae TaxID=230148 RepID=A0A4Z2EM26_9TELE|nr:hypothetical protein EYF80_060229 [Liparis tanakae]